MPESAHTAGGAHLSGDVQAGTFIGRDQIIVLSGYTGEELERVLAHLREMLSSGRADLCANLNQEQLTVTAAGATPVTLSGQAAKDLFPVAARQADEGSYLTALLVNPRYGRWASQFVPLAGTLTTVERPPGWNDVPPEYTLLELTGEGPGRQLRRTPLEDITQAMTRYKALALLGEPGSGKTTTLYKLALDAARLRLTAGDGPLPFFLSLADYRDFPSPHAFFSTLSTQYLGEGDPTDRLRRGELLLLCDALNEMPFRDERDYRARVAAWRSFAGDWPGNRLVFTCRSLDYSDPLGLPQVEIQRLDDGRVQDFLGKYLAAHEGLANEAWDRLVATPLLELVRNPYYLSMLAYIIASGGAWPASRARLFESFVKLLLRREETRQHADWPGAAGLQAALATLAERIQPLGEGTRLPRDEMLKRIPSQVDGPYGPLPPQTVLRLGLEATLLDTEGAPGSEVVRFYHHQLQEYFAAKALLTRSKADEDLTDRWRAPRLVHDMPDPGPLGDYEPLPSPPTTGWEEPTILAAGLASDPAALVEAVMHVNPALAARCLVESGVERPADLVGAVQRDLLAEMGDGRVHLRARLAAGDVLGRLGDPRFREVEVTGHRVLLPPLVRIPAGTVHMGSSRWQVWRLTRRQFPAEDELPRHAVQVVEFSIGQFPVTNAEYACFVAAGGYREEAYWRTAAARAWLRGEVTESGMVGEYMELWRDLQANPARLQQYRQAGWSPRAVTSWERALEMQESEIRELLNKQYADRPRDRPAFWDDERRNGPAQPVVGVNWFEASAYCCWLEDQMRHVPGTQVSGTVIRLPAEAEWERAARLGRGRVYPWGNRWDPGRANTWEGHVLRPNPVGVFGTGASPEGVHDLSGNVWEWTSSLYQPYPYRPGDGRNEPEAEGPRVVRGGSGYSNRGFARCAVRLRLIPDDVFLVRLGFRVVASLSF